MKNVYESLYNYNLNCLLYDDEAKKELGWFEAREYSDKTTEGGFVHGGIASGGHNYTIATLDDCIKRANDLCCIVIVEGVRYRIQGKRVKIISPPRAPKVVEYILVLE